MNSPGENGFANKVSDAEETLRLIARLPAPAGLEERVKRALRMNSSASKVVPWPAEYAPSGKWTHSAWARCAAAAAIVAIVTGGSWTVLPHHQPARASKAIPLPHVSAAPGFENANAIRTPQTLQGPVVKRVPKSSEPAPKNAQKRKPHAGRRQTAPQPGEPK